MRCDILSLFPEVFEPYINSSIMRRAQAKGLLELRLYDLRRYSTNKHLQVDDMPYGGGPGMVLKPEPIFRAVTELTEGLKNKRIILTTPQGKPFSHQLALELAREEYILIICGRYEGVDERAAQALVTDEISIGDYVLTGGELPALVILDAVTRLIPGVLGDEASVREDSFCQALLEYPQYTRPAVYQGLEVPEILLSGNHEQIRRWRRYQALKRTYLRRPELLDKLRLSVEDQELLKNIVKNEENGLS
jgi:tRNA (guanine37-N1)-methyltransferase